MTHPKSNKNYRLKSFADVIQRIKVESFDGEADMITANDHKTIELKGKYRNGQLCRIHITTYEMKDSLSEGQAFGGSGVVAPIAEYSDVRLFPMER